MSSLDYFEKFYQGIVAEAPLPQGIISKSTGVTGGGTQCQCDCCECAGGDTSDD